MGEAEGLTELQVTRLEGSRGPVLVAGERAVATIVGWLSEDLQWSLPACMAADLEQIKDQVPCHLPYPPQSHKGLDFDWSKEGAGKFPGCDEPFCFQHDSLQTRSLKESPGEDFLDNRMWHMQRFSPVFNISQSPVFRKLGITFWDSRRLMGFELLGPVKEDGFAPSTRGIIKYFGLLELMYTWISIADIATV